MPPIIDLTSITWQQFAVIAAVVSAVDLVTGIIYAIAPPNVFSFALAARFLESHVLKRVIPLGGLAAIAQSIPPSPTHDGLWVFAVGGLALYVGETVKSISDNRAVSNVDLTSGFIPSDPGELVGPPPAPDTDTAALPPSVL